MAADALPAAAHAASESFVFEHLGQSWLVLPMVLLAIALAWWAWTRYGPAPAGAAGRIARLCRVAALVLALIIIAGPSWRRTYVTDLPYRMLVAVDRSASMGRSDGPHGQPRIVVASELASALEGLKKDNPLLAVDYRAIGAVQGPIDPKELIAHTITTPGTSSPLADELDRLVADTRPDLLVVLTDGRVTSGSSLEAIASRWHARDLQTMALAAGTDAVLPELLIDEVVANREAAKDENETVVVRMSGRALPPGPVQVTLQLENEPPQTVTVEVPPAATPEAAMALRPLEARLDTTFRTEGPAKLHIQASAGTLQAAAQDLTVQVRERRLTVLMLGQRPFYELRYMREAFKRDKTVTLHAYLADGRWRRWGTAGPDDLPLQPEELAVYDTIIIGDLGRDAFRDSDMEHIQKAVKNGGAGLVWLMSETGAISSFTGTPLGELLPVNLPDAQAVTRGFLEGAPRHLSRTQPAISLGLLDPATDGGLDWPQLPPLLGAAPLTQAMVPQGSQILAQDQDGNPLVVTRDYPPGKAVLIGVDDTWRWRRNVGDQYLHRFQSQLLRYAASGRSGGGNRSWRLFALPRRAVPGESVELSLEKIGQPDSPPESVTVELDGPGGAQQLVRLEHVGDGYSAKIAAPGPGSWSMAVNAGIDSRKVDPGELRVLEPQDEMRDPRLDRPALEAFAATTGGTLFNDVPTLIHALPKDLRRSESITVHAGLWDTWWALLLLAALLAIEWSLRRLARLP